MIMRKFVRQAVQQSDRLRAIVGSQGGDREQHPRVGRQVVSALGRKLQ